MIKRMEISGIHMTLDDNLKKYVTKKIASCDRYLSRQSRESVRAEIKLAESKAKDKKTCTCEVVMHLPHATLAMQETTVNMYAAVDIVEAKLKLQLKKYKDRHASPKFRRRLMARLKRARSDSRPSIS